MLTRTFDPRDIRAFITPRLRERLLAKMQFQVSGCIYWVGAYNTDGRKAGRRFQPRRPVIYLGSAVGYPNIVVYVGPLILAIAGAGDLQPVDPETGARLYACHTCRKAEGDDHYRCVAEEHLRWGTQHENEQDKKQVERLPAGHEEVPADESRDHT